MIQSKFSMADVRRTLLAAYKKLQSTPDGISGKSSDGWCELQFPAIWDYLDGQDGFDEPCGLTIYSYALGPSRQHYINRGPVDCQVNYYTWESPDIFRKAVEVIESWAADIDEPAG
jgi:hypothetical protein